MVKSELQIIKNQKIFYKSSESMEEIEDGSIDVVITSPPYNRGKEYSDDSKIIYNDKQELKNYYNLLKTVWDECYRVLKETGVFFLNIGDAAIDQGKSEKVVQTAINSGFSRIQTVIWVKSFLGKGHYTPSGGEKRLNNVWENIFILAKNKDRYKIYPKQIGIPYADKSNIGRYSNEDLRDPGNVWLIPYSNTTGATIKKGHDAPFPIELPIKCMKLTKAEKVLDPFLGSGTTLAASRFLGLKGYGYEKYPRKNLINDTITRDYQAIPEETLLPHLEVVIEFLSSIINNNKIGLKSSDLIRGTKKQKNQLEIIKTVLDNKNIKIQLIEDLLAHYLNSSKQNLIENKKISIQTDLVKYLEENKIK